MKILKVIHGYPLRYNAGSEVYSQTLCQGLADEHEVTVFTREENPFTEDFSLREEQDPHDARVRLQLINIPLEKHRYRYQQNEVDTQFALLLDRLQPSVVHIGHLNHLSTSLVPLIARKRIPLIYTLHDYWLMCPRGQFLQRRSPCSTELWPLCSGQEDRKCATHCYSGYFSGGAQDAASDEEYWTKWTMQRMQHMRDIASHIDYFIAPAQYLLERYKRDFGLPQEKLVYLDYGFKRERFQNRQRVSNEPFTFGYIGTHIPAKGIQHLIQAFGLVRGEAILRIWGRPRAQNTEGLKALAASLSNGTEKRIQWMGEYTNQTILEEVFNHVDAIVVPSIWVENSPLVIHEALEAKVPVLTANAGGMAEYIQDEVNGLLFEHRNPNDLAQKMQTLMNDPTHAKKLGQRGYLQSADGHIPDIQTHVQEVVAIYRKALMEKNVLANALAQAD